MFIESALAVCDLRQCLLQRSGGFRWRQCTRRLALQIGDCAADRVHLLLDLLFAGAALGDQLIEPAVELGDDRDQLARGLRLALVALFRSSSTQCGYLAPLACKVVESRMQLVEAFVDRRPRLLARKRHRLLELGSAPRGVVSPVRRLSHRCLTGVLEALSAPPPANEFVPILACLEITLVPLAFPIVALRRIRLLALIHVSGRLLFALVRICGLRNHAVEPFADRHAGPTRCFARSLARLPRHAAHLPRRTGFHARILNRPREEDEAMALAQPGWVTGDGKATRPCILADEFFPFAVNRALTAGVKKGLMNQLIRHPELTNPAKVCKSCFVLIG